MVLKNTLSIFFLFFGETIPYHKSQLIMKEFNFKSLKEYRNDQII